MNCEQNKQKKLIALKKANSLINKIIEMVENDEYCIDIMQQSLAAMGLLKSFHQTALENHLHTCFKKGMESSSEKKKKEIIDEVIKVINLNK